MGTLNIKENNNFLFLDIDHKYPSFARQDAGVSASLYGANQGDYSHLYISIDTDQKMGSGNMFFPDGINTGIEAASAWEYCLYVYDEKNFGIFEQNLNQLANPSAGGQKMQVNFIPSNNGKVKIKVKVPKALIGNPETIRFVILTSKPGTGATGTSTAMDVAPGGMNAIIGGIVYGSTEVQMPPRPGTVIISEATYYLFDGQGRSLCEIDNSGNLKTKFYYLNGQLLARSNIVGTTPAAGTPLNNELETLSNCASATGDGSSLTAFSLETTGVVPDEPNTLNSFNLILPGINPNVKQGSGAVKAVTGSTGWGGNYGLVDQNTSWNTQDYRYVHIWVKPSTNAQWVTLHAYDRSASKWRDMQNYTDGDVKFYVGKDLKAGQWNEVWVDLYKNQQLLTTGEVSSFSMHCNNGATIYWDHIYTTANSGYDLAYYHNDHLGSPRAMTNAWGAVVWRQDYMAFGQDYSATATGNNYKFNGKPLEAAGLYYYGARYYNPELGRFTAPDPIIQPGSPYAYCGNNPVGYIDPTGMAAVPYIDYEGRDYQRNGGGDWNTVYGTVTVRAKCADGSVYFVAVYPFSIISNVHGVVFSDYEQAYSSGKGFAIARAEILSKANSTQIAPMQPINEFLSAMTPNSGQDKLLEEVIANSRSLIQCKLESNNGDGATFDIDAAVTELENSAEHDWTGYCARHIKGALKAGGLPVDNIHGPAKTYGPILNNFGFETVDQAGYIAQKGEIVVFQDYAGQKPGPYGHIQMYSGSNWISDRVQPNGFWANQKYKTTTYEIYRWGGQ